MHTHKVVHKKCKQQTFIISSNTGHCWPSGLCGTACRTTLLMRTVCILLRNTLKPTSTTVPISCKCLLRTCEGGKCCNNAYQLWVWRLRTNDAQVPASYPHGEKRVAASGRRKSTPASIASSYGTPTCYLQVGLPVNYNLGSGPVVGWNRLVAKSLARCDSMMATCCL